MNAGKLLLAATLVLCACASRPSDWRPLGNRLQQGMSEAQAIAALGFAPSTVEVVSCGGDRGQAWECRMLTFESSGSAPQHPLIVYEANQVGVWRVDSWHTL